MIFARTYDLIPDRKWQTRCVVKPGDMASHDAEGRIVAVYREVKDWDFKTNTWRKRLLWRVGDTIAIQPGRGKKAIGRTPPITEIRKERLRGILSRDIIAEGFPSRTGSAGWADLSAFKDLWNSLHDPPEDWYSDPEVWVLVFPKQEAKA